MPHYYPGTKMSHYGELARPRPARSGRVFRHRGVRHADPRHRRQASDADAAGRDVRRRVAARAPGAAQRGGLLLRTRRRPRLRPRAAHLRRPRVPRHARALQPRRGRHVVNGLSLDTYLRGVVPSESPSHWPVAALEAQAVAARSYALAELQPTSWYDLVPTTADQVYGGVRAETAALRPRRLRDARPGADVGRPGRTDVLLLELRRPNRVRAGRLARRGADPVPALGAGSVRHVLAASRLGPVQLLLVAPRAAWVWAAPSSRPRCRRDGSLRAESVVFRLASGADVRRSATPSLGRCTSCRTGSRSDSCRSRRAAAVCSTGAA